MQVSFHFFLGGQDLEMLEIAALAARAGCIIHDSKPGWGAKLSDYATAIEQCHRAGHVPVAVELADDMDAQWFVRARLVLVDHHNEGAFRPTSLEQVFALLQQPAGEWTRRFTLVAANDKAHIPGLVAAGATLEEVAAIRAEDRAAQGVNASQEQQALLALRQARVLEGLLTRVDLPHTRMAPLADALALDPAFAALPRNCLVTAPGEIGFFGQGRAVQALARLVPGGWYGGNLPEQGFWGHSGRNVAPDRIEAICLQALGFQDATSKDR